LGKADCAGFGGMGAKELLKAYLAYKKELFRRVRLMARKIPDAVLHHKMNLNTRTIAKPRDGGPLPMTTLRRLAELPDEAKFDARRTS
jgi:hypothetical protein